MNTFAKKVLSRKLLSENFDAPILYENSDGNVAEWVEVLNDAACYTFTDDGDHQKLEAVNPPGNSDGRWRYDNAIALTWTDYEFRFALGHSIERPWSIYFGVRTLLDGSGMYFEKGMHVGQWVPRGPNWHIIKNESYEIENGDTIKIRITGIDAAAVVKIFQNGLLVLHADTPDANRNTGSIFLGMLSHLFTPKPTMHFTFKDLLVRGL